nr:peroxisomal fatty acid beta-oxidation multifunctional protein AIM1-like [Tanacetum cinerariifolium]
MRPIFFPSSESLGLDVNIISIAFGNLTSLGSRCVPPEPGIISRDNSGKPSCAFRTAMRAWHPIETSNPAPKKAIMFLEDESCPVYDTDNEQEESMPVNDTDIEDVNEEEEDGDKDEGVYADQINQNELNRSVDNGNYSLGYKLDARLKPRGVKKVAVIGGGLMGSGIATALIISNIFVVLKEVNSEYLLKGIKTVEANIRGMIARKKLAQSRAEKTLTMIRGVLDYSEFKDVDMVIEAVIENVHLKQTIFSEIEKVCLPHCILATNTSTIDLNLVGEKLRSQDRVVGAYFFSPTYVMPFVRDCSNIKDFCTGDS